MSITKCKDCGLPYGGDGWLDMVIPDQQWKIICPEYEDEEVILCANCICARMEKCGATVVLSWADQLMPPDEFLEWISAQRKEKYIRRINNYLKIVQKRRGSNEQT